MFSDPVRPLFTPLGSNSNLAERPLTPVGCSSLIAIAVTRPIVVSYSDDHYLRVYQYRPGYEELASHRNKERVADISIHPMGL